MGVFPIIVLFSNKRHLSLNHDYETKSLVSLVMSCHFSLSPYCNTHICCKSPGKNYENIMSISCPLKKPSYIVREKTSSFETTHLKPRLHGNLALAFWPRWLVFFCFEKVGIRIFI